MQRAAFSLFAPFLLPFLASPLSAQESLAPFEAAVVAFPDSASIDSLADLNGDGKVDGLGWTWRYWRRYNQVTLSAFVRDGRGAFRKLWSGNYFTSLMTASTSGLDVGRINADGRDDWVVALSRTVIAHVSDASGRPTSYATWTEAAPVRALRVADFNRDGKDDVVLAASGIRLYLNTGTGFRLAATYGTSASDVYTAELDGDGKPDLVVPAGTTVELLFFRSGKLVRGQVHTHGFQRQDKPMYVPATSTETRTTTSSSSARRRATSCCAGPRRRRCASSPGRPAGPRPGSRTSTGTATWTGSAAEAEDRAPTTTISRRPSTSR